MNTRLLSGIIVFLLFCSSCSETPSDGNAADQITYDHIISFELNGGGFDNTIVHSDSLTSTMTSYEWKFGRFTYTAMVAFFDSVHSTYTLKLTMPSLSSGVYQWSDLNKDSTGFGCEITKSITTPTGIIRYRSVSGSTSVKMFAPSGINAFPDSLFGIFAGTLKDSLGHTITVSHGKFY